MLITLPFNWHILPLIVCITEDERIQAHEAHLHNEGIWSWDQRSAALSYPHQQTQLSGAACVEIFNFIR